MKKHFIYKKLARRPPTPLSPPRPSSSPANQKNDLEFQYEITKNIAHPTFPPTPRTPLEHRPSPRNRPIVSMPVRIALLECEVPTMRTHCIPSLESKRIHCGGSASRREVPVPLGRLPRIGTCYHRLLPLQCLLLRLLSSILPSPSLATWAELALVSSDIYSHSSLIAHSRTHALNSLDWLLWRGYHLYTIIRK